MPKPTLREDQDELLGIISRREISWILKELETYCSDQANGYRSLLRELWEVKAAILHICLQQLLKNTRKIRPKPITPAKREKLQNEYTFDSNGNAELNLPIIK